MLNFRSFEIVDIDQTTNDGASLLRLAYRMALRSSAGQDISKFEVDELVLTALAIGAIIQPIEDRG